MNGQHETTHGPLVGVLRGLSLTMAAAAIGAAGCATAIEIPGDSTGSGGDTTTTTTTTTSTITTSTTTTSSSSATSGACGQDCSAITTPQCMMAVCNDGSYPGTVGACLVLEAPAGDPCDDGEFCTLDDACDGTGECVGGYMNDCGMAPPECTTVACDELTKSCKASPANDGASCTPTDPCEINGVCMSGTCQGDVKDCSFSPDVECNTVTCNSTSGSCEPIPNAAKNGTPCILTGDLCMTGRTCHDGACAGGTAKDCSALTAECITGVCDPLNGACTGQPVAPGGACFDGIDQCHAGVCDASSTCVATMLADGTPCNDSNTCTQDDACALGVCAGTPVAGCATYFTTGFEPCPGGFAFTGEWQCGTPTNVGPTSAHHGQNVIATELASNYANGDAYATCAATSPSIDLTSASAPKLSFWTWYETEGSSYDGFHLEISTNNGATFNVVTSVTPAYPLTVNSQPAWGGEQGSSGWQNYLADLSAYKGHQAIFRFAFRSDSSVTRAGVYIDDIVVAEAAAVPLSITTAALLDAVAGHPYASALARWGGTSAAQWSIVGGTNAGWLTIDPTTGLLGGTPAASNVGPVSVTVKVQEPTVPGNTDAKTLHFNVISAVYFEAFEGVCPNGWTLGGDWQCGTPSSVGPTAWGGSQCLATRLAGNYNNSQSWTTCTATSPAIDLTTASHPKLTFRMWINTEGSSYDGANLKVSTDGGATFAIVSNVVPAYNLSSVNGEQAWGEDQSSEGWQLVQADLSACIGHTIRLRFAFRSDSLVTEPGVYLDDILVSDP